MKKLFSCLRCWMGPIRPMNPMSPMSPMSPMRLISLAVVLLFALHSSLFTLQSCSPEPPLHLYDAQEVMMDLPIIDLELDVYWDYNDYGDGYDWQDEWYYGWDDSDRRIFGELGYAEPTVFNLRRYYTGITPLAPHTGVVVNTVEGRRYQGRYDWGFWDLLVWNRISTIDGVQSLVFDEQTSLDSVVARTNESMQTARYHAPKYTRSFYAPEPLFSAYERGIEVNRNLDSFTYDTERKVWTRKLNMMLLPITYIYLTQVILHHNKGRIAAIDGSSNLSGMARTTTVNTGIAGQDAITVYYNSRMKRECPLLPYKVTANGMPENYGNVEIVDIIGGRLVTFGMCNQAPNTIRSRSEVTDGQRHYMDVTMQFNNGTDSTFVFDVTEQVRKRYKGGVITVELDVDTISIPTRSGGSGFDAVVEETKDGGTHEFDI